MTTPNMIRCKDCAYLVESKNGEWLCGDCAYEGDERNIEDIADEDCSGEQDW